MKHSILLFILFLLIYSCSNDEHQDLQIIDLSSGLPHPTEIKLSDFVEDIEFIFLETTKSSLISRIDKIRVTDNYFLVFEIQSTALLFDRKGAFIRRIGSIGIGPGEYIRIMDAEISQDERKIFILSGGLKPATNIYDINGSFISSETHGFYATGFSAFNGYKVYYTGFPYSYYVNNGFSLNVYYIRNIIDCDNFVFIELIIHRKYHNAIFDKSSRQLYEVKDRFPINDIAGPRNIWFKEFAMDNQVYSVFDIVDLKKDKQINTISPLRDFKRHKAYSDKLKSFDINDNPCVAILHLKNSLELQSKSEQ